MLPDHLVPGLRLVFVGTAVGLQSALRRHYYAGRGNHFWRLLAESGLTPIRLTPSDDATLPSYGIGLTDLVKTVAQSHDRGLAEHYDVPLFERKITESKPRVVAFTSKQAAAVVARYHGHGPPFWGAARWTVGGRPVFVLPSPSGANNRRTEPSREEWWRRLAVFVGDSGVAERYEATSE
jgi:double-stranded uracil-DNA glycosylase